MFRKISSAAADAHSFSSPFTRPPKPTPFNSRNPTSLLQMFRKISSAAAADTPSFSSLASPPNGKLSSLFTRPPKPTPLNSRNLTSLLQIFRKISSAAADARSFSSLASPFTRPPKPTPLNSRNSTSLFTYAESSQDEPKTGVSTARLRKFLQTNCKSGDVTADEAFGFFHRMVQMEPRFPLYSFNLLLKGLAKNERYYDVVSLFSKMNSGGLTPNFSTLNILLNCSCNKNRVCEAFLVLGRILRKGYSPTIVTFNSLIKGLCMGRRVDDAVQLYLTLEKFGCRPDVNTWRTLNLGLRLCGLGNTSNALKFHDENVIGNGQYSQRDDVSCTCFIIDGYCKSGKEYDALKIFLQMRGWGYSVDVRVYNSLMNGFCCAGKRDVAQLLLEDMLGQEIPFDGKTFYVVIDIFCQTGYTEGVKCLLDWMIKHGIDLRSEPVNIYDGSKTGEIEEAN